MSTERVCEENVICVSRRQCMLFREFLHLLSAQGVGAAGGGYGRLYFGNVCCLLRAYLRRF